MPPKTVEADTGGFTAAFDNPHGDLPDSETPLPSGSDAFIPLYNGIALDEIIDEPGDSQSKSTPSSHNEYVSKYIPPKPLGIGS